MKKQGFYCLGCTVVMFDTSDMIERCGWGGIEVKVVSREE